MQPWFAKQASLWNWGGGLQEALDQMWDVREDLGGAEEEESSRDSKRGVGLAWALLCVCFDPRNSPQKRGARPSGPLTLGERALPCPTPQGDICPPKDRLSTNFLGARETPNPNSMWLVPRSPWRGGGGEGGRTARPAFLNAQMKGGGVQKKRRSRLPL